MNNKRSLALPKSMAAIMCWCILFTSASWANSPTKENQSVDLSWVLQQTLLKNPTLQAFDFDMRVLEARAIQAAIRPNPELSASIENVLGTGEVSAFRRAETNVVLSQLIELGDKRQRRIDVVSSNQAQRQTQYEVERLNVFSQATSAYYQVLRWQALLDWSAQRIKIEARALAAIKKRASAGNVMASDVSKMALHLARTKAAHQQYLGQTKLAKYRLSSLWAQESTFSAAQGKFTQAQHYPSLERVLKAVDNAPQYLNLLSEERVLEAKQRLAQANGQYDINLGVGIRRFEDIDDSALMVEFSMPIPLNNPNRGNVLAANVAQEKAKQLTVLMRQQLRLSLIQAHQAMRNNIAQATLAKGELIPLAQKLLSDTQAAYRIGKSSVLELLSAQDELFGLQRQVIEKNIAAMTQLLELERITGVPLGKSEHSGVTSLEIK